MERERVKYGLRTSRIGKQGTQNKAGSGVTPCLIRLLMSTCSGQPSTGTYYKQLHYKKPQGKRGGEKKNKNAESVNTTSMDKKRMLFCVLHHPIDGKGKGKGKGYTAISASEGS